MFLTEILYVFHNTSIMLTIQTQITKPNILKGPYMLWDHVKAGKSNVSLIDSLHVCRQKNFYTYVM